MINEMIKPFKYIFKSTLSTIPTIFKFITPLLILWVALHFTTDSYIFLKKNRIFEGLANDGKKCDKRMPHEKEEYHNIQEGYNGAVPKREGLGYVSISNCNSCNS